ADRGGELLAGDGLTCTLRELDEDAKLVRRERHGEAGSLDGARPEVDRDRTDHDARGGLRDARARLLGAAKDGAYTREELAWIEGLRHVIVRADLEPDDPIGVVAARCEHDDRNIMTRSNAPADLEAIHSGEHDVEENDVVRMTLRERVERGLP